MATLGQWIEGARPRTLPAAVSPVLGGAGAAWFAGGRIRWLVAAGCLLVSLALQVGVNFANDYSDGIRGTDADRVGPMRLVGSGAAPPRQVKLAAFGCFAVAAGAGLAVVAGSGQWWLLLVGLGCILAAWYYTGGQHPYGYAGWGEVMVFLCFGLVAVLGTTQVLLGRVTWDALYGAVAVGAISCAVLVANNLRDLVSDRACGKRTLATRLGDRGSRWFYLALALTAAAAVGLAALSTPWALLGLLGVVLLAGPARTVLAGAQGPALIGVLRNTGLAGLVLAAGLTLGWALGS